MLAFCMGPEDHVWMPDIGTRNYESEVDLEPPRYQRCWNPRKAINEEWNQSGRKLFVAGNIDGQEVEVLKSALPSALEKQNLELA